MNLQSQASRRKRPSLWPSWFLISLLGLTGCGFFTRGEDGSLQIDPSPQFCIDNLTASGLGSTVVNAGQSVTFELKLTVDEITGNCASLPSPQWTITSPPNPAVATASLSGNVLTITGLNNPRQAVVQGDFFGSSGVYTSTTVSLANAPAGARNISVTATVTVRQTDFVERSEKDDGDKFGFRVAPGALNFGNTTVNTEAVQSLYVSNVGDEGTVEEPEFIRVTVAISGPNAADFSLGTFSGTLLSLGEGKVLQTPVIFRPRSAGFKSAQLTVNTTSTLGDAFSTQLNLTGTGVSP